MLRSVYFLYSADIRDWFGISNIDSNSSIIGMTNFDTNQNISWFVDRAILKDLVINIHDLINNDIGISVYNNVQQNAQYRFIVVKHIDRYTLILSERAIDSNTLSFELTKHNFDDLLQYIQSLLGKR